jgi:hypothetical protein
MITYVGFYEIEVTNVYGNKDILTIRMDVKPNWFKRIVAKHILKMEWHDKIVEMNPIDRAYSKRNVKNAKRK